METVTVQISLNGLAQCYKFPDHDLERGGTSAIVTGGQRYED